MFSRFWNWANNRYADNGNDILYKGGFRLMKSKYRIIFVNYETIGDATIEKHLQVYTGNSFIRTVLFFALKCHRKGYNQYWIIREGD